MNVLMKIVSFYIASPNFCASVDSIFKPSTDAENVFK